MRTSDVETLNKVPAALGAFLPINELALYNEYEAVCKFLTDKNTKEKQAYQDKAEYHREVTRKWRRDNVERSRAYQREYHKNKKNKGV
jgi:hypothetical protein